MAQKMIPQADVGLIVLAVMVQNLVLNMADHGYRVAVYNRTTATMSAFVAAHPDTPGGLIGCKSVPAFVRQLKRPRKIIVLVKAGPAVDTVIAPLLRHLDKGDIIIDGGNSLWTDTIRREKELFTKGIHFVGSGVSGGEEGARFGPSLMPGCSREAWRHIKPIWNALAAKVDLRLEEERVHHHGAARRVDERCGGVRRGRSGQPRGCRSEGGLRADGAAQASATGDAVTGGPIGSGRAVRPCGWHGDLAVASR